VGGSMVKPIDSGSIKIIQIHSQITCVLHYQRRFNDKKKKGHDCFHYVGVDGMYDNNVFKLTINNTKSPLSFEIN
jgi:hypothetical protein